MLDAKWLEILKATGWQLTAIAVACALFLLGGNWQWWPPLSPWMSQLAGFIMLLTGSLAIASFVAAFLKFFPVQKWAVHSINIWRERHAIRQYIPHMTEHERRIISYLLHRNEKSFLAELDGGYAATLLSRGIVRIAVTPGQEFRRIDVPMIVPDHIWDELLREKERFPYSPPPRGQAEAHPWRVPWMAR